MSKAKLLFTFCFESWNRQWSKWFVKVRPKVNPEGGEESKWTCVVFSFRLRIQSTGFKAVA